MKALAPLSLLLLLCGLAHGAKCDRHASFPSTHTVLVYGSDSTTTVTRAARDCWAGGKGVPRIVGYKTGLTDSKGKTLIPARYNQIIPLSSAFSLVEKKSLDDKPDADDGWYLYEHNEGEGKKLPWPRFTLLRDPDGATRPGMMVAAGYFDGLPVGAAGRLDKHMGLVTSQMRTVMDFPDLYGHDLLGYIDPSDSNRGERRAIQRFGRNAFVVHRKDGSQVFNLSGEPLTDRISRVEVPSWGRNALIPLMRARHPDLPVQTGGGPNISGQSVDQLYLPLDENANIIALPTGAIGIMWIAGYSQPRGALDIIGWAIVYARGTGYEVAPGLGSVEEVLSRAESLPRYSGMDTGRSIGRMALKQIGSGEWITVPTITLKVDGDSIPQASLDSAWRQYERVVTARRLAEAQRRQQELAAEEARRQQALAAAREQERQREAAAQAQAERERARFEGMLAARSCHWELRRVIRSMGNDALRRFFENCSMYGEEDFDLAARVGVDAGRIQRARNDYVWHQAKLQAEQQRIGNLNALSAAMKARPADNYWTDVRVYNQNGIYQGTTTMTRTQAEILGARP